MPLRALVSKSVVSRLRDALWLLRGIDLANPKLPEHVESVLFVCKGNICRSPFAALLARRLAEQVGMSECRIESAGITPSRDGRCPMEAIHAAAVHGVDLSPHQPSQLDAPLGQEFDLIVVMDAEQFSLLRGRWPFWNGKIVLLSLLDPVSVSPFLRYNIVDPFGRPRDAFDVCYERLERSVRKLLLTLASKGTRGVPAGATGAAGRERLR